MWEEIFSQIVSKNKHELSLNGSVLTKLLESDSEHARINPKLFELKQLNFLQLSNSQIYEIPEQVNELTNLQKLSLFGNQILCIPSIEESFILFSFDHYTQIICFFSEIDNLKNLNHLDLSNNSIMQIDCDFSVLVHLSTVNFSGNAIKDCKIKSQWIHIIYLSRNKLENFPELFLDSLTELHIDNNEINNIPHNIIEKLPNLKLLDMSQNKLTEIPKALATLKLKNLNLKENPLKDKRLSKYIHQNQALKIIIDHIQKFGISLTPSINERDENKIMSTLKNERLNQIVIKKFDEDFRVDYDASVKDIRSFILCCVVNNFELSAPKLKEFLQFQTKLHETICKKREAATIATHDFDTLNPKYLCYAAKHKNEVKIQPLNRRSTLTGSEYFDILRQEADAYRKEKKRSQVPGLFKFLQLLEDKKEFAFLEIKNGPTISLPPLTNSEITKMNCSTRRVFIEVTSNQNAAICNQIMVEMVRKMHEMNSTSDNNVLELQQVKITTTNNELKTLFPSKLDLKELESDKLQIIRP
jgi:Leucine rich repeat